MPKRKDVQLRVEFHLDRNSNISLDRQIAQTIRHAVAEGLLRAGDRLQPIRVLSDYLGVARATIDSAYAMLIAEGYVETFHGRGSFIAVNPPTQSQFWESGSEHGPKTIKPKTLGKHAKDCEKALWDLLVQADVPLAIISTSAEASPGRDFTDILTRTIQRHSLKQVYSHPAGIPALREAICEIGSRLRGVRAEPDQVIITSGSQLGLMMSLKVLFSPGDKIWIEDPQYPLLRGAAATQDLNAVYVPVDEEGFNLKRALEIAPDAKGVFITPSHQAPLGMMMSIARRRQLLNWAAENGAWIVEDDYDSEMRYGGNLPYPSLQGMDDGSNVIYIGTFSKMLFPGMRLGFMIVPKELVNAFCGMRFLIDRQGYELMQMAVAEYMRQGLYEAHIFRMRRIFEAKRDYLIESVNNNFGEWGRFISTEQGMHMTFLFNNPELDDEAVAADCRAQGVEVRSVSSFYAGTPLCRGLVLGFGFFPPEQILAAVSRIGFVLRDRYSAFL